MLSLSSSLSCTHPDWGGIDAARSLKGAAHRPSNVLSHTSTTTLFRALLDLRAFGVVHYICKDIPHRRGACLDTGGTVYSAASYRALVLSYSLTQLKTTFIYDYACNRQMYSKHFKLVYVPQKINENSSQEKQNFHL